MLRYLGNLLDPSPPTSSLKGHLGFQGKGTSEDLQMGAVFPDPLVSKEMGITQLTALPS